MLNSVRSCEGSWVDVPASARHMERADSTKSDVIAINRKYRQLTLII